MKHLYGGGRNVGRRASPSPRFSLLRKRKALHALAGKRSKKADEKELKKLSCSKKRDRFAKRRIGEAEGLLAKIKPASTLVMVEIQTRDSRHVLRQYLSPKQKVDAGAGEPSCLEQEWPRNRLGLAKWLVDPGNPLVARVTVNRWWGQLLERGSYPRKRISGSANPPLIPGFLTGWPSSSWRMAGP